MYMKKKSAFTLVELLMVVAIIGILAGILIPAVGKVLDKAKVAASKTQLNNYVNAIQLFKGEYNYFPLQAAQVDGGGMLGTDIVYEEFMVTLAARNLDGTPVQPTDEKYGNRKLISFHTFTESDFQDGDPSTEIIADRFNNTNIYIVIDEDGDGKLEGLPDDNGGFTTEVRNHVTAYTLANPAAGSAPSYFLYE